MKSDLTYHGKHLAVFGLALSLNDVLTMLGIVLVICQIAHLAWRWRRQAKQDKIGDD